MSLVLASADLAVSDEAFAYLKVQRGRIADLADDRQAWEAAYNRELAQTYHHIAPWLPERCDKLLDVGSGLGGIDVLIARHYGGADLFLLDGERDPPEVHRHASTFNHMGVATRFLAANGAKVCGCWSPRGLPVSPQIDLRFDLVVSFQAWGFHFEPATYLGFVLERLAPAGRVILDLRRRHMPWLGQLLGAGLKVVGRPHECDKFERLVLERR